jgi:hypothetical protein
MNTLTLLLASASLSLLTPACVGSNAAETKPASLKQSLVLHASFDRGLDADFAAGDKTLYHAPTGNRQQPQPGLPEGQVALAKGEGRFGDGLRFNKKGKAVVFFKGDKNFGYNTNNWSATCSFWLRLDPDKDLEPGYCDPLQFVAQAWNEGNMFVEFSKDHTPRHFRYAIRAQLQYWNPKNLGWEAIPDAERPMVAMHKPPFTRERWTHVCFAFGNIYSGKKDGWGKLWLDGKLQGEMNGWQNTFNWEADKSAITIGLAYIGLFDDLAIFNRPLTDAEVKAIFEAKGGVTALVK